MSEITLPEDISDATELTDLDTSSSIYSENDSDIDIQLLEAQRQWEESLAQLSKALHWVILPLLGKFMGRRVATIIWKHVDGLYW